jgi:hypothetical protein
MSKIIYSTIRPAILDDELVILVTKNLNILNGDVPDKETFEYFNFGVLYYEINIQKINDIVKE